MLKFEIKEPETLEEIQKRKIEINQEMNEAQKILGELDAEWVLLTNLEIDMNNEIQKAKEPRTVEQIVAQLKKIDNWINKSYKVINELEDKEYLLQELLKGYKQKSAVITTTDND